MNKVELINEVSEKANISKKDARLFLDTLTGTITEELSKGETVAIANFGSFCVTDRNPRKCKNPKTGEEILVPAKTVPKLKFGKKIKEAVNTVG